MPNTLSAWHKHAAHTCGNRCRWMRYAMRAPGRSSMLMCVARRRFNGTGDQAWADMLAQLSLVKDHPALVTPKPNTFRRPSLPLLPYYPTSLPYPPLAATIVAKRHCLCLVFTLFRDQDSAFPCVSAAILGLTVPFLVSIVVRGPPGRVLRLRRLLPRQGEYRRARVRLSPARVECRLSIAAHQPPNGGEHCV